MFLEKVRHVIETYQHTESVLLHEKDTYTKDIESLRVQQKTLDSDVLAMQVAIDDCVKNINALQ